MEVLGETLGVEHIDKGRVLSPRPSPRRTMSQQQSSHHKRSAAIVGAKSSGLDPLHAGRCSDDQANAARGGASGGSGYRSSQTGHMQPPEGSSEQHQHKTSYRSNQGSSSSSGKEGYRRRRRGEGVLRTRVTRQSPVEERLSVHEDEGPSDAFDDDGLFQIDENFAKFLDDKTSCQK